MKRGTRLPAANLPKEAIAVQTSERPPLVDRKQDPAVLPFPPAPPADRAPAGPLFDRQPPPQPPVETLVPQPPVPPVGDGRGRAPSVLYRLAMSTAVLGIGVLAATDLAGASIRSSAYVAVPLAAVGLALVVGAWHGHARLLIPLGVVLTLALAVTGIVNGVGGSTGDVTWRPASVEQLDRSYEINVGNALLDLSTIDFAGRAATVEVHVAFGNLNVVLPSTVDVEVTADVGVGNATVFDQRWSGINQSERNVVDQGFDGPGGGTLVIRATVDVGDLEVRR